MKKDTKKKENRIIQFKGFKLSANKSYYGSISYVEVDHKKKKVRVFAELEKVPEVNFMKSLPYSENYHSPMGTFFRKLGAIDDHGKLNLDNLEGRPVEVTLYKGNDDNWYVNEMFLMITYLHQKIFYQIIFAKSKLIANYYKLKQIKTV